MSFGSDSIAQARRPTARASRSITAAALVGAALVAATAASAEERPDYRSTSGSIHLRYLNAGDGEMWGAEAELSASPVPGLDIDGSLSWIDGKWKRISAQVTSIKLNDPITTPNWRGSFGIQYKADLGQSGTLTPRFDLVYTGKQSQGRLAITRPLDYNPSFVLANARLTWRNADEDLSVSFEVQNLFDKYYYLPLRFAALYGSAGTAYSTLGRPREWAVTVRKTF